MPQQNRTLTAMSASDFTAAVASEIDRFLAARRDQLLDIDASLAPVAQAAFDFTAGGKRVRPLFCWWGWQGAGGDPADPRLVAAATSLEFVQACALAHDDLMDRSDTRRGEPSMHRRFEAHHRDINGLGDPVGFGAGAAILLGDMFLSWSDEILLTSGMPVDVLLSARRIFDAMRTEVTAGQFLDLAEQSRVDLDVGRAELVMRFKTAKYTVERPLHLGGVLAGADPALLSAYSAYALPIGEAFQMRDDVLGVFGDAEHTGKPSGDDIIEGKHTVLVALAMQRGTPAQRETLSAALGNPDADVAAARQILTDTGALAEVEDRIEELTARALEALTGAGIGENARQGLTDMAYAATRRSR